VSPPCCVFADGSAAPWVSGELVPHAMVVDTTPKSHASTKPPMFCPFLPFRLSHASARS
jgi:hypothetical protein